MINNIKHIQNITFIAGLIKNHTPPNTTCKNRSVVPNIIRNISSVVPNIIRNIITAIIIPSKINIFIWVYSNFLLLYFLSLYSKAFLEYQNPLLPARYQIFHLMYNIQ